jgi:arylsulfatase A-like enzyme
MKIIVLIIDSLRADSLSCYGYPLETSPQFDRLAGEGVLFENAYTQANWTNPSLYSLLTGLYPSIHGVGDFNQNLGKDVSTITGHLARKGFRTVLFSNYYVLLDQERLGRHFQQKVYFDLDNDGEKLCRMISAGPDSDLFALIHVGNYVHEPYCAPPEEVKRFWNADFPKSKVIRALTEETGLDDESMQNVLRRVNLRREWLNRREISFLKACYDAGIRHVDDHLAGFFDYLQRDCEEEVVLVITADHGQGFFEHGFFGHGLNLNEELVRIPLIFWRNRARQPARIKSTIQMIDLFPTFLDVLGEEAAPELDGISFAGCLDGKEEVSRWAISEGQPFLACVRDRKKLIISIYRLMGAAERIGRLKELLAKRQFRKLLLHLYSLLRGGLYDLDQDPEERRNLIRSDPATAARMKDHLAAWYKAASLRTPEITTDEMDDEKMIEQLKSLGYL